MILVIGVPVYIAAWWSANLPFKAVSGVFLLLGIVLFVAWLVATALRIGYRNLTTPQLGALVGLVVLVVGSALGVTLQIQYATNHQRAARRPDRRPRGDAGQRIPDPGRHVPGLPGAAR